MKIVIVRSGHLGGGGMSRVIECWARTLGESGHETTVVSEAADSAHELPPLRNVTSELTRSTAGAGRSTKLFIRAKAAVEKLRELDQRVGIDLIISHDSPFSGAVRRAFRRTPLLQTFHSPLVDENRLNNWKYARSLSRRVSYPLSWALFWHLERRALRSISCAHTLSDYAWSLLSTRYPRACSAVPWVKVPGTYDDSRFVLPADRTAVRRQLGLDPGKRLLLTVRRLVPRNAVERIVAAAKTLRERLRDVEFLIGGTGEMQEGLRHRIEADGLTEHVSLLGFIPEDRLAAYYQAADAFLMPTRDLECFGLPVIEAMACGCLPLVMPDGGPAEICRDHPQWIAVENSSGAFTDLVRGYLSGRIPEPDQPVAELARTRYSERAVRSSILRLVESVAGRDSRAG